MTQIPLFDHEPTAKTEFLSELADFRAFGAPSRRQRIDGVDYIENEFWTAGQRRSHALHEISYRACFKAQLPAFFIERLTRPGDTVFDPFMGRGTTPLQAALMERRAIGADVNPLAVLLARPRFNPPAPAMITAALKSVDWAAGAIETEGLLAFYHPETLAKLEALRRWLAERLPPDAPTIDPVADWIRMVAINRLSGHSPGFFSGRSMPPNQAVSIEAQRKINDKLGQTPPVRDIGGIIEKKTRSLLRNGVPPQPAHARLYVGPAWAAPDIGDATIDLVVTSPPFLDVVQYAADNWLRCWFAGIDPGQVRIDCHRTLDGWSEMVRRVLAEMARVVRPGGHVAFEVGEVRGGRILLEQTVWRAAEELPFDRLCVMVNAQQFTKTANCWGVSNGSKGTNTNRIAIFRRR
jgi:SAM-dependent methyltransferase